MTTPRATVLPLTRWAALLQLAYFEANSRGSRRFTGIARSRRISSLMVLYAVAPVFLLPLLERLGVQRETPLWWTCAAFLGAWAAAILTFMMSVTVLSLFRAAKVRRLMDASRLTRYPRFPRSRSKVR